MNLIPALYLCLCGTRHICIYYLYSTVFLGVHGSKVSWVILQIQSFSLPWALASYMVHVYLEFVGRRCSRSKWPEKILGIALAMSYIVAAWICIFLTSQILPNLYKKCFSVCSFWQPITSRIHGEKEKQSFSQCGSFDHPDLQSHNDYKIYFLFYDCKIKCLGACDIPLDRWFQDLSNNMLQAPK